MKWGCFLVKKVENGGVSVKKWKFPQRRVHYVQYQYFLFYILLIWGCVRTQRILPAYGPDQSPARPHICIEQSPHICKSGVGMSRDLKVQSRGRQLPAV